MNRFAVEAYAIGYYYGRAIGNDEERETVLGGFPAEERDRCAEAFRDGYEVGVAAFCRTFLAEDEDEGASLSRESHPALYPTQPAHVHDHFVPDGWEEADRGICPCGEVVVWNTATECWDPDRTMRVLVLTADEADAVRRSVSGLTQTMVEYQLDTQGMAGQDWSPIVGED